MVTVVDKHLDSIYLVLALEKVLMIGTLQWFHWHEQHMLKVDPNFSIAHLSYVSSQIFNIIQTYKLINTIYKAI